MKLFKYIGLAIENLKINRGRSFLTMLGIIIGIFNLTLVVAILEGGRKVILEEISGLGADVVHIFSTYPIKEQDQLLIKRCPGVAKALPAVFLSTTIKVGKESKDVFVRGVTPEFERIFKIKILKGRFVKESDVFKKKKVCVIAEDISKEGHFFIGSDLVINNERLKVIGICKEKMILSKTIGSFFILPPLSTLQRIMQTEDVMFVNVIVKDSKNAEQVAEQLDRLLNKKYYGEKRFQIRSMKEMVSSIEKVAGIIALMVASIAAISLLVGGIGIMNIMLVSVNERTREIGIRKALGATNKDITLQFLIESSFLTIFGGVIGLILGLLLANIIVYFLKMPFVIGIEYLILGLFVSFCVGLVFGLYPAKVASKITPIEALRYE